MERLTHKKMILEYMRVGNNLTTLDALQLFGCMRLSAVIHDMRKDGYAIKTIVCEEKNRFGKLIQYAKYGLADDDRVAR